MAKQFRSVRSSFQYLLAAGALTVMCSAPARADHNAGPALAEELLSGLVHERDVSLVFSFLRDAWRAAVHGGEVRPPYEIEQRGNVIAEELKRRGSILGERALDAMERNIRDELRRKPLPPPSGPYQRM